MLGAVERLPLVEAVKLSFYAYPLLNALHILTIGMVVTAVIVMDLRLLGLLRFVERAPLVRLMRRLIAVALPLAVLSGLMLFSVQAREYAANPAFQIKLGLLALAGLNFWAFHRLAGPDGGAFPPSAAARTLAAVSITLWTGILVAGRFIGFL